MYNSGKKGALRKFVNGLAVGYNYIKGLVNPYGTAWIPEGARRQLVGASIYHKIHSGDNTYSVKDTDHAALGGLDGKHFGEEFRKSHGLLGYIRQAVTSPYHNILG